MDDSANQPITNDGDTETSAIDWDKRERDAAEEEARLESENSGNTEDSGAKEAETFNASSASNSQEATSSNTDAPSRTYAADLDPSSYTVGEDNRPVNDDDSEQGGEPADRFAQDTEKAQNGSVDMTGNEDSEIAEEGNSGSGAADEYDADGNEQLVINSDLPELSQDQIDRFEQLSARYEKHGERLQDPSARRNAFVMPFITSLGYDVFDPDEVETAFNTIGKQADYAIKSEDRKILFITMSDNMSDEARSKTDRTLACLEDNEFAAAVITDGREYRVYAGKASNQYDQPAFIHELDSPVTQALVTLTKNGFDIDAMLEYGAIEETREAIFSAVRQELTFPSEGFVEAIIDRLVKSGVKVPGNMDAHVEAVTRPLADHLEKAIAEAEAAAKSAAEAEDNDDRVMTAEESAAFEIIRDICAVHTDVSNIVARPAKSYLAILLHDNNRRTIARLHFNYSTKYVGTFIERDETRNKIEGPAGVAEYAQQFLERMHELDPSIDITPKDADAQEQAEEA